MTLHLQIFKKYSWDDDIEEDEEDTTCHIIEEIQRQWDMESAEGNYGFEDGGWMALILNIAESLTEDQHKELAAYFKSTVESVNWNEEASK